MKSRHLFLIGVAAGAGLTLFALHFIPTRSHPTITRANRVMAQAESPASRAVRSNLNPVSVPWAAVESTNYSEYVANLRRVGCPEDNISAILFADLRHTLGPVPGRDLIAYGRAAMNQNKQIYAMIKELGVPAESEVGDYFFSADQRGLVKKALIRYPAMPVTTAQEKNRAALRRSLIGALTYEQEVYLKSEFENYGGTVQSVLAGFVPTQQEYYTMIASMDSNTKEALLSKMDTILAPSRLQQWRALQTPEHLAIYGFVQAFSQASGRENELEGILHEMPDLTYQEYRDKLRAILPRDAFDKFLSDHPYTNSVPAN